MHKRFAHLRVRDEWFRPDAELLEYIRTEAQGHETDESVHVAIRLPIMWAKDIEDIAKRMSSPALHIKRVQVLREAIYLGIQQLKERKKR